MGEQYFGVFAEDVIKSNFVVIYELVDEICDFGFPQVTDANTLKLLVSGTSDQPFERKADVFEGNCRSERLKLLRRLRSRLQARFLGGGQTLFISATKHLWTS